jgi:hypothetical protein
MSELLTKGMQFTINVAKDEQMIFNKKESKEMLRVYVAGKYSADNVLDVLRNIGHGRKVCAELFALGFAPFCPWYDADFIIQNPDGQFTVKQFYDYSIAWLAVSNVMLVISGVEDSTGVHGEIEFCKKNNIPIVYSIQELLSSY